MSCQMITDLLEAMMILCFGISWPLSLYRSYKSRTARGKSLFFEVFIWGGYVFGITRKIMIWKMAAAPLGWLFYLSWFLYVLNIVEISLDVLLYFRNTRLDREETIEFMAEQ